VRTEHLHFILFFGIVVCSSFQVVEKEKTKDLYKNVSFVQDTRETLLSAGNNRIELNKDDFSIRYYNKAYDGDNGYFHATQIAAFANKQEWDKINVGKLKSELSCFEPGSGMAPDESGRYESLIFNESGHHYLVYSDQENTGLTLLGKWQNYLKLEFLVNSLFLNEMEMKMTDATLKNFYIAIVIDRNLNDRIDPDELTKVEVILRPKKLN
jgi:hypothetical protein